MDKAESWKEKVLRRDDTKMGGFGLNEKCYVWRHEDNTSSIRTFARL